MADIKCPNYKSDEWRELVSLVGSDKQAEMLYMTYGDIPTKDMLEKDGLLPTKKELSRFQALVDDLEQRKSRLNNKISSLRSERKSIPIPSNIKEDDIITYRFAEKKKINVKIQGLLRNIKEIDSKLEDLSKIDMLESIKPFAEEDLAKVDKILESPTVTENDLINVKNTLLLWIKAGDFTNGNIFWTKEEYEQLSKDNPIYTEIANQFSVWRVKAEALNNKYTELMYSLYEKKASAQFGKPITIPKEMKDVGGMTEYLLSINMVDNALLQTMSEFGRLADFHSKKDAKIILDELSNLFKEHSTKYKIKETEELFQQTQSNEDNRKTGNLVARFTQKFFNWRKDKKYKLESTIKAITFDTDISEENKKKRINKLYKDYYTEEKAAMIMFDVRKLFPDQSLYKGEFKIEDIEKHKQELIATVGKKGYDFYTECIKIQLEEYKEAKEAKRVDLEVLFGENEAMLTMVMEEWEVTNNPYLLAESFFDNTSAMYNGKYVNQNKEFTTIVPRRTIGGKETGFYDNKFTKIEENEDYYKLYSFLLETLHELNGYLPENIKGEMQMNSLPFMVKTLMENYNEQGVTGGLSPLWDYIKENLREGTTSTYEASDKLNVLGEEDRSLKINYVANVDRIIADYIDLQSIKYKQSNGNQEPTYELKQELKKDALNDIASRRTFNLEKLVKGYALSSLGYKHKCKVADTMQLGWEIINNAKQIKTNNADETVTKSYGGNATEEGLPNMKRMVSHFLNHFYGDRMTAQEMVSNKKLYTKEELDKKAELESALAKNEVDKDSLTRKEYIQRKRILTQQLDSLGGYITGNKVGDVLNNYVRLKGLGWNIFSPIMNINYGFISNLIEGSGGLYFNNEDLLTGYKLTWTKKAQNIMKRLDVMKTIQNEVQETERVKKKFNFLAPMTMQEKSEYMNQTPVMIAMAKKFKLKLEDGSELSYWDCFDDYGELKVNINIEDFEDKFKPKVDKVITKIHGNYDTNQPISANKHLLGRSLLVFRKWMINAFYDRLGKGLKEDLILEGDTKGRWRSYGAYFSQNGAKGIFDITLNLLRKIAFQKTKMDGLSEVDAANMRKNLTEIMALIAITSLALLLKSQLDDDDNDSKYLCYFWLNQLNRVSMDITFYTDPTQFKTLIRDPIPMFSIVTDGYKAINKSFLLLGEEAGIDYEDTYKTGVYKGQSKAGIAVKRMIPGIGNVTRIKSTTSQIINK
jgi:hypothetical protein